MGCTLPKQKATEPKPIMEKKKPQPPDINVDDVDHSSDSHPSNVIQKTHKEENKIEIQIPSNPSSPNNNVK